MTWYVASLRDHDTHLARDRAGEPVTAVCGRSFRPLARLIGHPADSQQVCPR
ncbi:MAG: hypothetical protein ACRDTE_13700 [Pseudonocardiaceae bacterium]